MVNEHKGKEFQAADEQAIDVALQYAGLSDSRANEAAELEPGQLPLSDHWPGQLLSPPEDNAGDPETDVGGDSDREPSPENSTPRFCLAMMWR